MAATITTIRNAGGGAWYFEWTGTPPFTLWSYGQNYAVFENDYATVQDPFDNSSVTTTRTSTTIITEDDVEPPVFGIIDSTEALPDDAFLNAMFLHLQWLRVPGAEAYIVQEEVSSVWTDRAVIREDGKQYYQYTSEGVEDGTTNNWRVKVIDREENEFVVTGISIEIVREPAPPSVTISYDKANAEIDIVSR